MSQLVGKTLKETPRDANSASHIFILRGGYARMVSAGIYSLLPLAYRVTTKIEKIIREEMDAIGCQEILMPVALPAELWQESGRYDSVGPELLRFRDRNDKEMLLAMTHEEAVVQLIRTEINSYKRLPAMVYQLQTKYRDEARPRAGLVRVREFTMKDAYSFHASQACLEAFYEKMHQAYERIFERVGMKTVVSIESDTGMMGGKRSHEFMAVTEAGEDTLFLSPDGKYQANREVAKSPFSIQKESAELLEEVHTPDKMTIADLAEFLGVPESRTGKAVFYATGEGQLVFAVIRGDIEVNETKLRNYLKATELRHATDAEIEAIGAVPGYASPFGLAVKQTRIIFDPTAKDSSNLVVGANKVDWHFKNFNFERDMTGVADKVEVVDIATVREGDPCPLSGEPLEMKRGIEVGNIFQLGTRYSESMNCRFLDQNGKSQPMVMGSYGIGVGRTMAAVIEQSHDKYGPIWPESIAPFQWQICALNYAQPEVKAAAEALYEKMTAEGIEVLLDDRNEKAGPMFNDSDLIGVPYRFVLSPKTLKEGKTEFKRRNSQEKQLIAVEEAVSFAKQQLGPSSK